MEATYGLEYALFFGVPENKVELIHGTSRLAFPFWSHEEGEAHFHEWLATLGRWKQISPSPPVRNSDGNLGADVGGIRMTLFPRPIEIRFPIAGKAFHAFLQTFNRRDYWPGQPEGYETGYDSALDGGDIRMRLWSLFRELSDRHGGEYSSRTDIALAPNMCAAPDAYYYCEGRDNIMIDGDCFCAAPDLVAEVLSAPSRCLDRGPRMEVYRRARVPHLWLLEPLSESIEVYELHSRYELVGRFSSGEKLSTPVFPGEEISVAQIFETQSKRWRNENDENDDDDTGALDPIPEWILPPEMNIGLEYFFLLGHPERRWEFWDNKARSVLAFGSAAEASARLETFLTEACRWESLPPARMTPLADDVEQAEIGRFQFTRRGRLVHMDLSFDGRYHHEILRRWASRDAWDWGESENSI